MGSSTGGTVEAGVQRDWCVWHASSGLTWIALPRPLSAGLAGILVWGAVGSSAVELPITKGPQATPAVGPRGRL